MAVGKNKRLSKKGKGGKKKKMVDAFEKKEWYKIRAPKFFDTRDVGWTPANQTQGQRVIRDNLMNRVYEVNYGDLGKDPYGADATDESVHKKVKLQVEEVVEQQKEVLTNFYGLSVTSDRMKSLIKKWQTLIEAHVDIKTTDGYVLRLFVVGFTKKQQGQMRKTSYAQSSQIRAIRQKMISIIRREAEDQDLKGLVLKLLPRLFGKEIEKLCETTYPLQDVYIKKAKMLKKAKYDQNRLFDLHQEGGDDDKPEDVERSPDDDE